MGWSVGRGCPLPTEARVWGGGCAPSPEIKKISSSMCSKNLYVQAKGGGASPSAPPPKYATASDPNYNRPTSATTDVLSKQHTALMNSEPVERRQNTGGRHCCGENV